MFIFSTGSLCRSLWCTWSKREHHNQVGCNELDSRWLCRKFHIRIAPLWFTAKELFINVMVHNCPLKEYLFGGRLLLQCTTSSNTAILQLQVGHWGGHGQRKKWFGAWWEPKQLNRETVQGSKEILHIAARKIQPLWIYCQELLTISRLQIAAKVEW